MTLRTIEAAAEAVARKIVPAFAAGVAGACSGQQSALSPDGPGAEDAAVLWWVMLAGGTAVFLLVLALLLYVLSLPPERRRPLKQPQTLVVAGGVLLPVVVLSLLLGFSINMGSSSYAQLPADSLRIAVSGRQWWWEVEYRDNGGGTDFVTANEIHVPVGEPVELLLTSRDVIHSLWVPRLAGKQDLVPGRTNRLVIQADRPGVYRAQCAEYCGTAHSQMALYVVARPPSEFDRWAERQRQPAAAPATALATQGAAAFATRGCLLCHTVRGHGAWGRQGPDLTHLGSRRTIGAGTLALSAEHISQWIAQNHRIKPGNRMPSFVELDRATRDAIAAYLVGLE